MQSNLLQCEARTISIGYQKKFTVKCVARKYLKGPSMMENSTRICIKHYNGWIDDKLFRF